MCLQTISSRGERELEHLLAQVDRAYEQGMGGGSGCGCSQQTVQDGEAPATVQLAQALDGEAMDVSALQEAWRAMPPELKQQLFATAKQLWQTREGNIQYFIAAAYTLMLGGMSMMPALRQAAVQLNIPLRRAPAAQPGLSRVQVSQYHQRQQQRGRRPGQNPQMRSRLQREAEALYEWASSRKPCP